MAVTASRAVPLSGKASHSRMQRYKSATPIDVRRHAGARGDGVRHFSSGIVRVPIRRSKGVTAASGAKHSSSNSRSSSDDSRELRGSPLSWGLPPAQLTAMAVAPFAAASLRIGDKKEGAEGDKKPEEDEGAFSAVKQGAEELYKKGRQLYDRIYYGDVLPPVGSVRMSYARFLDLMNQKRVKRVTVLGDGAVAIVEIPVEGWASNTDDVKHDRRDPEIMYAKQRPEWQMEKHRFYVELPGDFWESGVVMEKLKLNLPHRNADGRIEYSKLLQEGQVTPELMVIDPSDQYVWLNQYAGQFIPIVGLILLRMVLGFGSWIVEKFGKKEKDEMQEMADQYSKSPAKSFNVKDEETPGTEKKGTGVTFADVAGIDRVKDDIMEVLEMMMGGERFGDMGAKMPRGILLEGPPGTGKTYLAKAMAGEAGIPFFSANGAEFVEMFQGVAAARVRNLFKTARKNAPAIVFIDEIDAIGKKRSATGDGDSGTAEREHGLLQLLQEMDGFTRLDRVLVIGATNRKNSLDDALLRPGRFDRSIYMGNPTRANRLKILEVHARNKQISRASSDKWPEGNALLNDIADLTIGYSGAELANLLNEAAILAVRANKAEIDYDIALAAMEKYKLGLDQPDIPESPAKRHMAHVQAGRTVLSALTAGMPPIEQVSMKPRGGQAARILFLPQETGRDGDQWHALGYGERQINAVEPHEPKGSYEFLKGLLVPMYAARATEEVLYGKRGVTLSTAKEIARAGDLAHWLVRTSTLHPAFRNHALHYDMIMGGQYDSVTKQMATTFEGLTLELQMEAYEKAKQTVRERLPVIKSIANDLCETKSATVQGADIIQRLQSTPLETVDAQVVDEAPKATAEKGQGGAIAAVSSSAGVGSASFRGQDGGASTFRQQQEEMSNGISSSSIPAEKMNGSSNGNGTKESFKEQLRAELRLPPHLLEDAIAVLSGQADETTLPGFASVSSNGNGGVRGPNTEDREKQIRRFATSVEAPFPESPKVPELTKEFIKDSSLYEWASKARPQQPDAEVEVLRL